MFGFGSWLYIPTTFPQNRGPTTDITQCCVCCYPRLNNEKPTSSASSQFCFTSPTSSSLLLQTERVNVFCLSPPTLTQPTSTHADNNAGIFSNALHSVTLSPLLCFDLFFSSLAFVNFWDIVFGFFTWWTGNLKDLISYIQKSTGRNP